MENTLARPADPTGLAYFAHSLQTGTSDEQLLAALYTSDGYFRIVIR